MANQENTHVKKSKRKVASLILIIVLLLLLISSCCVSLWAIFFRDDVPTVAPDYAPPVLEPNAEPTDEPEDTPKFESEEGGGKVTISYETDMTIDLSDGKVYWKYKHPKASNQDVMVQLIIQDRLIFKSGLIKAGNEIKVLDLNGEQVQMGVGNYTGRVELYYYHPETGERAVLSTDLTNITIKVQE